MVAWTTAEGGRGDRAGRTGDSDVGDSSRVAADAATEELAALGRLRQRMLGEAGAPGPLGSGPRQIPTLELSPGSTVRRYRLVHPLGSGGMGEVWLADDPELARRVAIKVLRPHASRDPVRARARLVREAQAIAQVAHPNVVAVYDAGVLDEDPRSIAAYIAMELVDGCTLGGWLQQRERSVEEILAVFVAAGRGLAAAHRAGQIHRDFKPANVMVTPGGAVKVLDFGLALADGELRSPSSGDTERVPRLASGSDQTDRLTEAGMVLGTPHFMSPEQHLGRPVTAATDQFSFCLALLEALQRGDAYLGRGPGELGRAKVRGMIQRGTRSVPASLRTTIVRGLSPAASDRWPSMDALLERLVRRPSRRWVALAASVAVGAFAIAGPMDDRCGPRDELVAARHDTLVEGLRARIDGRNATRLLERLQAHERALLSAEESTCVAHHDRELDDAAFDRRVACLRERRGELEVALDAIEGEAGPRARADAQLDGLGDLDRCTDDSRLASTTAPPTDPGVARAVDIARSRLTSARAMQLAGLPRQAASEVADARAAVASIDHPPITAEIDALDGEIAIERNDPTAVTLLERALATAQTHGNDALAAATAARLVVAAAFQTADAEFLDAIIPRADAVILRAGDPPEARADFLLALGTVHTKRGEYAEALAASEAARERYAAAFGRDHRKYDGASFNRAIALANLRRFDDAVAAAAEVVVAREGAIGPNHADTISALGILGVCQTEAGALDDARATLQRAIERADAYLGPMHAELAFALGALGGVAERRGELDEARALFARALEVAEHNAGASSAEVATTAGGLGRVELALGRHDDARRHLEQAIAGHERMLGHRHALVAETTRLLAETELASGNAARARALAHEAIAILESLSATPEQLALVKRPLREAERRLAAPATTALAEG